MKSIDVDRAVQVVNRQIEAIEKAQNDPEADTGKLTSQVMTMARGLAALLAEMRKTDEDVDEKLKSLTPEREATLTLKLIERASPEYRAAFALRIEELDGKLIAHGA